MPEGWDFTDIQPSRNTYTTGDWLTETDSAAALDQILLSLDAFHVHQEVTGYPLQPRLDTHLQRLRIDRVLIPKTHLIAQGWDYGPIGIEIKKSRTKIGPVISQMLDYSRALWQVASNPGVWFALQCVFLWPLEQTSGPIASILNQQRLGSAETDRYDLLRLTSGEQTLARFNHDGTIRIGQALNGRKAGSR